MTAARAIKPARSLFFARTALLMLAMVISAFLITYFQALLTGSRVFPAVYHIHGVAYFAWMGLYAWQTHLVATGRTARHRELGLAGIALSALMVPLGVSLAIHAINRRIAAGNPHPFDTTLYNVIDITLFAVLMTASIASVTRHPDWHRRFTFGAALCLVGPAVSRWFLNPWIMPVPQLSPWSDLAPNLTADLFLIALILYDRRTLGRVHPATLWVCALLVPIHIATPFLTGSVWWRELAPSILKLG